MRMTRNVVVAVVLGSTVALSGCARQIDPGTYDGRSVGDVVRTYEGVVQSVRVVEVEEGELLEQNKTGQLIGGVAGGFLGSIFGEGLGKAAAAAGGAIGGAIVGSLIEEEVKRQPALEYIVRDRDGNLVTIVQGIDPEIPVGSAVYVQEGSRGRSRISPAL